MFLPIMSLPLPQSYLQMKSALILLAVIFGVLVVSCIVFTLVSAQIKCRRSTRHAQKTILGMMYLTTVIVLICTIVCFARYRSAMDTVIHNGDSPSITGSVDSATC